MTVWREVLLAFRPKTLTAAFVPCVAASALVIGTRQLFDGSTLIFALIAAFLIQIATNLINDAVDFAKGADTAERIGPRRITASGVLTGKQTMMIAGVCLLLAIAAGVPLVLRGGWPIVALGLISVVMAYAYTAGPLPLAYVGLGDLFVVIFFGLVAVGGLFYLHAGHLTWDALWLGLQIGMHAAVLIAINNLRDHVGDAKVRKRTLAVRFGVPFSRVEIAALAAVPFYMNAWWFFRGNIVATLLPLVALPLAYAVAKGVYADEPGPVYNKYLGMAAGLHFSFGSLLAAGLAWG